MSQFWLMAFFGHSAEKRGRSKEKLHHDGQILLVRNTVAVEVCVMAAAYVDVFAWHIKFKPGLYPFATR